MGRLRFYFFLTTVISLLSLSTIVYSGTFTDTFDDPNFTNSNWMVYDTGVQQTWSFPLIGPANSGYHVSTTSSSAPGAMLANNGIEYYSTDLYIEALVRIDSHSGAYASESIAGLAFSMTQGTGYVAAISLDFYDGDNKVLFGLAALGEYKLSGLDVTPVPITFDTFYRLVVQIGSNQDIRAYLYNLDGTLLGSVSAANVLSIDSGAVGIFGGLEVTFDDYTLTGNPVGHTGSLSQTQISQLYVSIFGRASEGEGNAYWQSWPDMATAANDMLETDAAKDYFGANLNTNQAFIEHIYLNTLNKTISDDADGITYWVDMLESGKSRGEVVSVLVGVIKNYAPTGSFYDPDNTATVAAYNQFINRVEVSDYMARTLWEPPVDWETSTNFSSGLVVSDNSATVYNAKYVIDALNLAYSTAPWPMHRHDAKNTGYSPFAGPSTGSLKWQFLLPSKVVSASPVIGTDGTIYMSNGQSGSGGVYAINPDGTQKWLYPGHSGDSAPAISTDGTVYMPGYRKFNAINPDGTLKWTYQAQNVFNYSSPTIGQDGTIYIGCGIDLLALNPGGNLLWQYRVGEDINSTPAVALDGTIYVRGTTDYLCAVNRNGSQKWKLNLGSNPSGYGMSPVIAADGTIYTNGISIYSYGPDYPDFEYNTLYAINPDGSTKWIYNAISPGGVSGIGTLVPALDLAGNIYLGGKVNDIWSTSAFFALNPSGILLWSYEMPQTDYFGKSSPAVDVNGVIYFGATNYLYALNPNGTLKWKHPTDIVGSSPAIGSNGTLYFGSGNGYLNAIGN
jgi:hypothetical protein